MAARSKRSLYLYLAMACFIGIIAIFILDGYLGIYDTIYITTGEQEMTVEPEYWSSRCPGAPKDYYTGGNWGEKIFFRYEVENNNFSSYSTSIQVSVWKENEKILDLLSEDRLIKSFDEAIVEWTLDSEELQAHGFDVGEYTVKVERNGIMRRVIMSYHNTSPESPYPKYPVPPRY
ncbi:hypothetical protein ACFLVV_00650 [Chloroflexota bacterium]